MKLFPMSWGARLACSGFLLLLVAASIATFTQDPLADRHGPACDRDPCWSLYLRCIWLLINSPIALGIGATAATVYGYFLWRGQLSAREDHEAAKEIVRASDRARLAFEHLRASGITASENAQSGSRDPLEMRLERLVKTLVQLEQAIDAGVVLWGRTYRDQIVPVRESLINLEFTLTECLRYRDSSDLFLKDKSVQAAQEFFGSGPQGDPIGRKLTGALQSIEEDARRRLIR